MTLDGDKILSNSTNGDDTYDLDGSGESDFVLIRDTNVQTLSGSGDAEFFVLFLAQADLDTEAERESFFNDFTNPDDLDFVKNGGLEFDGSNDYVDAGTGSSLDMGSGDFTLSLWFKSSGTAADAIAGKGGVEAGGKRYLLTLNDPTGCATGGIKGEIDDNTTSKFVCSVGTSYNDGQWYHTAVVRDGNNLRLYIDGVEDGNSPTDITGYGSLDSSRIFSIGSIFSEVSAQQVSFFDGIIDEVRVWNDARTQNEIRDNMFKQVDSTSANLVGYWRLNDASGQNVNDETTNNNDGTLGANSSAATDDPSWTLGYDNLTNGVGGGWSDAPSAAALLFDGSNDTVNAGNASSLDIERTSPMTYEAWIKTTTDGNQSIIEKKENAAPFRGYGMLTGSGGFIFFQMISTFSSSTLEVRSINDLNYSDGNWHHVAITYDGSSAPSGVTIYFDGLSVSTTTTINTLSTTISTTANFYIGSRNAGGQFFNGTIDEVRLWTVERTASEIKDNMYTQIDPTSANLTGYWRINENTGSTTHDETTNDNDGTLTGGPVWATGYVPDFYNEAEGAQTILMNAPDNALEFDGSNDFVDVAHDASFDFTNTDSFTLSVWFKTSKDYTDEGYMITKYALASPYEGYRIYVNDSDEKVHFEVDHGAVHDTAFTSTGLNDGNWHHVAGVYTPSRMDVYLDGVLGTPDTTIQAGDISNTRPLGIGSSPGGTTRHFDGLLDDVRIYDIALTQTQIQDTMHGPLVGNEANLVAYWKFDEGTGQLALDSTSNHNDGSLGASTASGTDDPAWTTGIVPDSYNTIDFDIDGGSNVSTLLNGAVSAEATSITVDSTTDFPASGIAYIEGDKFSYVSVTATTFDRIPTLGELAVIAHADNTLVSLMNRHKPFYKIRSYRDTVEPSSITLEGSTLTAGTDYNVEIKPFTTSYFAQDLVFAAPLESTTVDVGTNLTNSGCTFVTARYGLGLKCNASSEDATFTSTSNIDYQKGALEFWFQPATASTDSIERVYFNQLSGSDQFRLMKSTANALEFLIHDGTTAFTESVASANYSWSSGDWVHIRLEWDDAATTANQQKIFINGVEPTHTDSSGDYDGTLVSPGTTFFLGNEADAGPDECNCILDEFNIYDFFGSGDRAELKKLSEGGDTADADEFLADDTNDYTFDFNDDDASNRGEYVWIGSDSPFAGVNQVLATDGVGSSEDFDWEYWNGTGWSALAVYDQDSGAHSFTADGTFYFIPPGNWFKYSVNGSTDSYYIRGHLEGGSYTTDPIEDTIKTDILLLQYLADITGTDQTFVVVPENLWLWFGLAPILPLVLRRRGKKARVAVSH